MPFQNGKLALTLAAALALFPALANAQDDPLGSLGSAFEKVAQKASAAVVQVVCDRVPGSDLPQPGGESTYNPQAAPREFHDKYAEERFLTIRPQGPTSGVIVGADGFVITSIYNIAGRIGNLRVVMPDGKVFPAEILGQDGNRDIALLKIKAAGLPFFDLSKAPSPRPGQFALSIGRCENPGEINVNSGIVSAVVRYRGDAIQTSARVNYANSGGALVDLDGNLLGVIARIGHDSERFRSGINTGVGFAAPARGIADAIDALKAGRNTAPRPSPFLGIRFDPSWTGDKGVRIEYVYKGFPSERAGIKPGDVLLNFDHVDIESQNDLRFVIEQCEPGQKVTFSITRGEEDLDLEGELTARPGPEDNVRMAAEYLLWKAPRGLGIRADMSWPGPGARAEHVHGSFPLGRGGFRSGEILLAVWGLRDLPGWFPILDLQYLDRTLQYCWEGAAVTFLVWGDGGIRTISMVVGRHATDAETTALDAEHEAAKKRLPAQPDAASKASMTIALARWLVTVNLGVSLSEKGPGEEGWEVAFVHRGFPGAARKISAGDIVHSVNSVKVADLVKDPRILASPPAKSIIYVKGDIWEVEATGDDMKKATYKLALIDMPEPAIVRAMEGEASGKFRLAPGDDKRFELVLADRNAAGRVQAVAALGGADDLGKTALDLVVSTLGDRNPDLAAAAAAALKRHASVRTLEALISALPVDKITIKEAGKADRAKLDAIKAVIASAAGAVEIPDHGVDGVLWQRWLRENRGSLRFAK